MLGPIGANLLSILKVMTPSEVERVSRSAHSKLIKETKAVDEEAVSFDEHDEANVIRLKNKKEENPSSEEKFKASEFKEGPKASESKKENFAAPKEMIINADTVIFIEEWRKSKDSKKKLSGKDGMKMYNKVSNYEPIKINSDDEDDVIISTGTSGILINKKQS